MSEYDSDDKIGMSFNDAVVLIMNTLPLQNINVDLVDYQFNGAGVDMSIDGNHFFEYEFIYKYDWVDNSAMIHFKSGDVQTGGVDTFFPTPFDMGNFVRGMYNQFKIEIERHRLKQRRDIALDDVQEAYENYGFGSSQHYDKFMLYHYAHDALEAFNKEYPV